jgi:glutamate-5-semialdehyde dehydrogenase
MEDRSPSVLQFALRARDAAPQLAKADGDAIDRAITIMADRLLDHQKALAVANHADVASAEAAGLPGGVLDRLRLGEDRIAAMSSQLRSLAKVPYDKTVVGHRDLDSGLRVEERRRPVGVVGANFEARPNVVVDIASQLLKSRNAGVLRTGSAAIRSASALVDVVIAPALAEAGLSPDAVQLVRTPGRESARELVMHPEVVPLVILRGSGASTRELAQLAATNGVRTLAHADGGGVVYLDASADRDTTRRIVETSLDRLGVCNRLNLLLVSSKIWDEVLGDVVEVLSGLGIEASLPPHDHALGHEWALDENRENTVTVSPVAGAREAALVVNRDTSGLAASIVAEDRDAVAEFLAACNATGLFVNATPRLLDGYKLLGLPETGINVDHVPGPRGPVTFRDLCLRQFVVTPAASSVIESG